MRHRKTGRKLNMDSSARKAMFRNMVTSLMLHGQIKTTEARAKELRRFADKVISMGKRAPSLSSIEGLEGDAQQQATAKRVHAIRRVKNWVNDDVAFAKVFGEYAERFRSRPGGYTRVVKMGRREGDNAPMAIIQLVETLEEVAPKATSKKVTSKKASSKKVSAADTAAADEEPTVAMEQVSETPGAASLSEE